MYEFPLTLTLLSAIWLVILVALSPSRMRWMSPPAAVLGYLGFYYLAHLTYLALGGSTISGWAFEPADIIRSVTLFGVLIVGFGIGYFFVGFWVRSTHFSDTAVIPNRPPKTAIGTAGNIANLCIVAGLGAALWMISNEQLRVTYVLDPAGVRTLDAKFLLNFLDLLIPGIILRFHYLRGQSSFWITIIILVATTVLFASAGSRYRLGVLYTALAAYGLLVNPTRLKLLIASCSAIAAIFLTGMLGIMRQYRGGLNFSQLMQADSDRLFAAAFNEASSVSVAGAVVDYVPAEEPYVHLAPVEHALLQFVPRIVWADKPYPDYLNVTWRAAGAGTENFGLALPLHGELYLMFGYPGVLVMAVGIGAVLRHYWSKLVSHQLHAHAAILFAIIPLILSRGYLAQAFTTLIFILGPLAAVHSWRKP